MTTRQSIYKAVDEEIERARKKYPKGDADYRFMGLASESGEALQAVVKWRQNPNPDTRQAARDELIQSMGQHVRVLEELAIFDQCPVCNDTGMIEDIFFHPDFGPDSEWRPCPACSKPTEIHWAAKLFFVVCAFLLLLMALGVL
jgi:hypothetical protein